MTSWTQCAKVTDLAAISARALCVYLSADYKCALMYLGVEALCILGDPVELWESEHVLLAAWPVKYPQSERRQCSKYLDCAQDKYTIIKAHNLMMSKCVYIYTYTMTRWTITVYIRLTALKEFCNILKMGSLKASALRPKSTHGGHENVRKHTLTHTCMHTNISGMQIEQW